VALSEVAQGVLGDLEAQIEESQARVEVGELPTVEADLTQMRQLLQNLVGNALKFRQQGVPPVVKVRGRILEGDGPRPAAGRCEITVEDNGIGFEQKYATRIFEAFQRLHGRMEYPGTGMGLAICRRIVDCHRGTIEARSAPGQGATFTVALPLEQHKEGSTA
jgi:light-regulated signal transduction histidine kinase (bacteriophytochrome)